MANVNCTACEELRQKASDFALNGVTDDVCTSLKNNTGFNPSNGNDDCTDLDNANDCLIGNMVDEIEAYDNCSWKDYVKLFAGNVHQIFKALICAICGIWTNIKNLWAKVNKHECEINALFKGISFKFGENYQEGESYIVAGKGVTWQFRSGSDDNTADIAIVYVGGAYTSIYGSVDFCTEDFTEEYAVTNFDNGSVERTSKTRKGNPMWDDLNRETDSFAINGGELIYELRINKAQYPQIKSITAGHGQETGGGSYHVRSSVYTAGDWAPGQHGSVMESTGEPAHEGNDSGHQVPEGWIYVQMRLTSKFSWNASVRDRKDAAGKNLVSAAYSPRSTCGMRLNRDDLEC